VPKTNKEDGKLDRDGMLWDVGVVMKDGVVFNESHEAVENRW
jgi:hypothetical protein